MTITFNGFADGIDYYPIVVFRIPSTLMAQGCEPSGSPYVSEIGALNFTTSTGQSFEDSQNDQILCNAAPATQTGGWAEGENGEPVITWFGDSGDLLNSGNIETWIQDGDHLFDCESLVISPLGDSVIDDYDCSDYGLWIDIDAGESGIARATFTINSVPGDFSTPSYVSCLEASGSTSQDDIEDLSLPLVAPANVGLGGSGCYEVFEPGGGDFLTKEVNTTELEPGDTITYTINASTSAEQWKTITITDEIPAGVDVESITCNVEPATFMADPCYELNGSTLTVAFAADDAQPSAPLAITIVIEGTVTAEPGTEIVNEACYERTLPEDEPYEPHVAPLAAGDPTIPGGGVICESVSTMVQNPPVPSPTPTTPTTPATETPAPSPSPSPTAPATETPVPTEPATEETPSATQPVDSTPVASSTPGAATTVEPEPTTSVSGLPSTGSGSNANTSLIVLSAAIGSILMISGALAMNRRQGA